jgi:serine/threonine protein kinase/Tfp pilus assembly protein PilF
MNEKESPEKTMTLASAGETAQTIGPYHLLQKIGEGGMGEIWLAEQHKPIRRKVALKIIKIGMDTKQVIARFQSERQALAMMDHPAIAKVFDAGETEQGRPYFVMEYVQGIPITAYCDTNRLSTQERLELFIRVCEGVQHAHQKAIIHRDLKPSNILVAVQDGKAVPKIIDFGVAKATAQNLTERTVYTELGTLIGTPEYMSPEQAEMTGQNIDTRTDIYSLGAVLYELLIGALPFDSKELRKAGFDEIRRKIREEDPPKPSTRLSTMREASTVSAKNRRTEPSSLIRQLKGDLDWITMKALEKDRTRRYAAPSELAADVGRFLNHQPVIARPPSAMYRAKKFVRRHRIGVGVAASLAVLLVAFSIAMAVQARRIARERDRANQEAETSKQVSAFLADLFNVSDPSEARGNSVTAREILDRGADKIAKELNGQPLVQARLMDTIGSVYVSLGLYKKAGPLLEEALRIRRETAGARGLDIAESLHSVGDVYRRQGKYQEAEKLFQEVLSIREEMLGKNDVRVASILHSLGILYDIQGKYGQAESLFRRELDIREKAPSVDHAALGGCLHSLAIELHSQGKDAEAESIFKRALAEKENALGPDHPDVARTLQSLGIFYQSQGKYGEAEPLLLQALAIREKVFGPEHPEMASNLMNLASFYEDQNKTKEAESYYKRALAIAEKALGPNHSNVGIVLHNLAELYRDEGRDKEAELLYKRSLAIWEGSLGPKHPYVAKSLGGLATLYRKMGRLAEAESLYKRAVAIQQEALGSEHPDLAETLADYALLLRREKRPQEAYVLEAQVKKIRDKNRK